MQIGCIQGLYFCTMEEKLELIKQIKKTKEKQSVLLEQLAKVIQNEGRNYHIFIDERTIVKGDYNIMFFLIKRETNEVLSYGTDTRLKSFMRIRNIKSSDVMNDANNFGDW